MAPRQALPTIGPGLSRLSLSAVVRERATTFISRGAMTVPQAFTTPSDKDRPSTEQE